MDIGIGLPISRPHLLRDWARRAERHGFACLALLDRLTYDNPEPLVALAVLAGATERIQLQSEVLLGPLRSTALLAKQVATLDVMSGGRFRLGIGVGGRADDHAAAGVPLGKRGALLDRQLHDVKRIWAQERFRSDTPGCGGVGGVIGPVPTSPGGPSILVGAFAPRALSRVAAHGDGFLCAAAPAWAGPLVTTVREQWRAAGRAGAPRIVGQLNVAIGSPDVGARAQAAIADYYAFTGSAGWGKPITDTGELREAVAAWAALGADEVVFYCYADQPEQVDALAAAVSSW